MNEQKVAILTVLTAALLVPSHRELAAQIASKLEAGQFTVNDGTSLPSSSLRLAPTFEYQTPYARITAHGSAFLTEQTLQLADGIVSGTFTSPTVYGVRAEMIGNASRAVDDRSLGTDQVDVQTRVHVLFHQRGGLWLGGGVARPWRVAVISSADVADAGAWTKLGGATFTATFTNFSFTKVASVHDSLRSALSCAAATSGTLPGPVSAVRFATTEASTPGACERQSRFSDLEGSLHWELGALELNAQSGYRFGDSYDVTPDSRRWSSASATVWLSDRVAVIGGGGRQPALPLRGLPARTFFMGGIELAYWPISHNTVPVSLPHAALLKSFDLKTADQGLEKIVIHVGGVENVEVMGDFSDWTPLTVTRRGRDLWELALPLSAGVHQINVRVDGGPWMAPPGVPTMHDSYDRDVGLIVVKDRSTH